MPVPFALVDAFTEAPFAGNPAGVCVLDRDPEPRWMQQVAAEANQAETAFLVPRGDRWALRWFTPMAEVDLCGHATLGSAHYLWESGRAPEGAPIVFRTKSGELTARRGAKDIALDFPALTSVWADMPPDLEDALGATVASFSASKFDCLVELESEAAVRDLKPDLARLSNLPWRGACVTAPATTPGFDFVSRFFAPGSGIDEDPVTGSAHCCLGPFWGARLGKTELTGYQASARGGVVRVTLAGARVLLGGQAVTVLRGQLG